MESPGFLAAREQHRFFSGIPVGVWAGVFSGETIADPDLLRGTMMLFSLSEELNEKTSKGPLKNRDLLLEARTNSPRGKNESNFPTSFEAARSKIAETTTPLADSIGKWLKGEHNYFE
jgi:hypothetical protein